MTDKKLCIKNEINIVKSGSEIDNLKFEIENMKELLNKKITENSESIYSKEILELSQKLDEIVVEYIKYI